MLVPEVTFGAPAGWVPGGILQRKLGSVRDEGAVLDDQRNLVGGNGPIGNQRLLGRVGDQVACSLACVYVQAGDAPGVIVVEHQAGALLVGIVEGHAAIAWRCAVRDAWQVC